MGRVGGAKTAERLTYGLSGWCQRTAGLTYGQSGECDMDTAPVTFF